jgi:hypothetical protein
MKKSNSQQSDSSDTQNAQLFPLPSFCLYSKKALANEYAPESDIIQFLSPISVTLQERLPMFVGVLQSLFTVVNDMPFLNDQDSDEEEEVEEEEEEEEGEIKEKEENSPFTIIGLNSMKLVVWNSMYDNLMENDIYENDLCLVVMLSVQMTDTTILHNMNLLRENVITSTSSTVTVSEFYLCLFSMYLHCKYL